MTAKAHQLNICITYLLSKFHDPWWKTELAMIFRSFNQPCASVYHQCIVEIQIGFRSYYQAKIADIRKGKHHVICLTLLEKKNLENQQLKKKLVQTVLRKNGAVIKCLCILAGFQLCVDLAQSSDIWLILYEFTQTH